MVWYKFRMSDFDYWLDLNIEDGLITQKEKTFFIRLMKEYFEKEDDD